MGRDLHLPGVAPDREQQCVLQEQVPLSATRRQQPLTSTCFLRGLRSLTILAFLAGFFSSRSLSPSPLEELAEALLSNLRGGTWRQRQLETPTPKRGSARWGRRSSDKQAARPAPELSQPPATHNSETS